MKLLTLVLCLLSGIMASVIVEVTVVEQETFSYLFILHYILSFFAVFVNGEKKCNTFLLFYMTFGLFLGGRFFAVALGGDQYSLFDGVAVFSPLHFSYDEFVETYRLVLTFSVCAVVGYGIYSLFFSNTQKNPTLLEDSKHTNIDSVLKNFFWVFVFFVFINRIQAIITVYHSGYTALYEASNSSELSSVSTSFYCVFLSFVGVAIAYGNNATSWKYLTLLFVYAFLTIISGSRGYFGGVLLSCIWLKYHYVKISLFKLVFFCFCFLSILLCASFFSLRNADQSMQSSYFKVLTDFLFEQGVSLRILWESIQLEYNPSHYFGALIPAWCTLNQCLLGNPLPIWEVAFAHYLAYSLNERLYFGGQGMGWTVISDIYLFAFRNTPVFILFSCIFGFIVRMIECSVKTNRFAKAYIFSSLLFFLLLPRAGFSMLIRMLIILSFTILLCRLFESFFSSSASKRLDTENKDT